MHSEERKDAESVLFFVCAPVISWIWKRVCGILYANESVALDRMRDCGKIAAEANERKNQGKGRAYAEID